MSKNRITWVILLIVLSSFVACTKSETYPDDNSGNHGGGTQMGNMVFWTSQAFGWSSLSVYVNNVLAGTTSKYFTVIPSCSADGAITISKPPGTYTFTANSSNGVAWSGNFTITAGVCNTQRLDFPADGGNGEGGNSGTNTAPSLVFWTSKSSGWSSIKVYQDDGTPNGVLVGTILGKYFNSKPDCGASGAITTQLPTVVFPHPYFAKSNTGITWSSFSIFGGLPGSCSSVRFDFPTNGSTDGTVVYQ